MARRRGKKSSAVVLLLPVVLAACSGDGGTSAVAGGKASTARCAATRVHYQPYTGVQPGLKPYPWIAASPASSGLVGHVFYYDRQNVWRRERLPRFQIYTGGQSPDGRISMKILWELRRGHAIALGLRGRQLGGVGAFSQELSSAGTTQFPSIVDVPKPGCWRLTLMAGGRTGHIDVIAVSRKTS